MDQSETYQVIHPGLRCLRAPNPGPMTHTGTNTYLIGTTEIAVIDPGPAHDGHLQAILQACAGQTISHILVTHSHLDHSPLARPLSDATGAPVHAFGPSDAGRSAVMMDLAAQGLAGGGEGIDPDFKPDLMLADGDIVTGRDWDIEAIHTPGHMGNHLSFALGDFCLTGDHVMGWASSLVSPPDGDLTDFMASCAKLRARDWRMFLPGHGDSIDDPAGRLDWLIGHRKGRETQIIAALQTGPQSAENLAARIYTDTPPALLPAATRNVFAHLVDLTGRDIVKPEGPLAASAVFQNCKSA